ncbi:MAG: glycosyltransferase family 2 protein [Anaerolineales bacterium]
MSEVDVNIVTWNSQPFIAACMNSILQQTFKDLEVTVVDNGSDDGTVQLLKDQFGSRARLITNSSNEGYCRAHNRAITVSDGTYVLTLNPDVVLAPTFLEHAVEAISAEPRVGAVNGKLLQIDPDQFDGGKFTVPEDEPRIDSIGLIMLRTRRQLLRGYQGGMSDSVHEKEFIFGPDGAAALYLREMLEDVKIEGQYFDESFFTHKEDVDLAWRAQLLGWKSLYSPDSVAYHVRGFRPGERRGMATEIKRHAVKNRYLMLMKNELPQTFWRDWPQILFYDLKILGYILLFERSSFLAYRDCIRLAPTALRWRRQIQKRRRADSNYMERLFR